MAPPENRNMLPAPKKKLWFLKFIATLRTLFVFCYSAPFICVLALSYSYMENAPVAGLMDYLTTSWEKEDLKKGVILMNLQDFLSSYAEIAVCQMSDDFTGCYTMIIICAAVSTTTLMLLWISALSVPGTEIWLNSHSEFSMVYVAIFLLPLGKAGQTLLRYFLEDQLADKVRAQEEKECKTEHGKTEDKKEKDHINIITNIWWRPALFAGNVLVIVLSSLIQSYSDSFKFAALLMGGAALLFSFGCAHYSRKSYENMPTESDLGKIRRIFHVALKKRKSRYPIDRTSSKDKAAIVEEQCADSDPSPHREEEMKGDICSVKEVKSLVPFMYLGFTSLFAYSLVLASENTLFVNQVSNLRPVIIKHGEDNGYDIPFLFVAKFIMREMSMFICWLINSAIEKLRKSQVTRSKRMVAVIIRIGIGMVCAVICCIVAWRVETRRLYLMNYEYNPDGKLSMTTIALVPQFLLLGITQGLLDGGLTNLLLVLASKSMWTFGNIFSQMVIGTGKLFSIPLFLIFSSWINKTAQTSHFDRYYLMLAILNFVFLLAFGYVSFSTIRYAYEGEFPNDEEIGKEQRLDDAHEEDSGSKCDMIKFGNSGSFNSGHRGSFRKIRTRDSK